jgi:hypothetical protein
VDHLATLTMNGLSMLIRSTEDICASKPRRPALIKILGKSAMVLSMKTGIIFCIPKGYVPPTW